MEKLRLVAETPDPAKSPFAEWGRLTRFLESARLAFARERNLWTCVEGPERVRVSTSDGTYKVALQKHLDAIDDAETLHGSVLVHSYAVAESAAADRLGASVRSLHGIEEWGARLLTANGRDWSDVQGGLIGAVEVAVARNAFAHWSRTIDEIAHARLLAAGAHTPPVGSAVTLTYDELREFRARLRSLLNAGGIRG